MEYQGNIPFSHFLKQFFSKQRKFGSRDRKSIATICYAYFRTASVWQKKNPDDEILKQAIFLCNQIKPEWQDGISSELLKMQEDGLDQKCDSLQLEFIHLFPFRNLLSPEIDENKFSSSFINQPHFYLRVRPGFQNQVVEKLRAKQIDFEIHEDVIKMENGISMDEVLKINKEVVVQDASSQRVFDFLNKSELLQRFVKPIRVWDVCAASGGKSILLSDRLSVPIKLTVSDNRSSMLHNLKKRLSEAGVSLFHAFSQDISSASGLSQNEKFSVIICDVPCTGSGTWARTPEQLVYFDERLIGSFVQKQKAIVQNAQRHLEIGGLLFYITCSVFKKENEDVCESVSQNTALRNLYQCYIKGYETGADTMFVSVFTN